MRIFTGAPRRSRERRRALDKFQSKTLRRNKAGASKVHRPCSGAGFWDEIAPAPSASSSVKAEGRCGRRPIRPGNRFPKETVTVPGGGFCFSAHGQGLKRKSGQGGSFRTAKLRVVHRLPLRGACRCAAPADIPSEPIRFGGSREPRLSAGA